ncbi:E3 ubiquitin-protein ligase TRIM21-like isoform X2 [Tachysurus fulvidraco]|uniref:E3 ubiquitin-protein ligase TRIM21-like isoform X2 n=1 Tax=Tachysurus fulvidraco TaxID=1234273 RepID=UPI001FF038D7|nr:E3 ubiquitin-protein ligase TRIM21-like isoform X2 [Tachysurus fulvidraco]
MAESSSPTESRRGNMEEPELFSHDSSSLLFLFDQLLCPICMDVLTDPVTTPCGHNFCKSCLTLCWDKNQHCQCPLCNQIFTKRPELKFNTTQREVIDHFKTKRGSDKPEVLCDACSGEKLKALKSCLDCGLSFCKIHLEPHYHVPKLKKHKLINPVENLEANICQKHERVQDRLKKIEEIQHSVEQSKRSTEKEKADIVEVFTALIRSFERSQAELPGMMEEKQKVAEMQAEGLIKELEQEISVLKIRDTELEQLSHTEEHLHLLQIYSSMCSPPHTKNWTEISIKTDVSGDTVRTALSQLQQTQNEKLTKLVNDKLKETVSTDLKWIQQYAVDVTLDPDTANPCLILSADGKRVRDGDKPQNLPDTPQRFCTCLCVLGNQSFCSGRFYYEVEVRWKSSWDVGVATENINRKGEITLTPEDGFWAVALRNKYRYKACAGPSVPLTLRERVEVVGVFVDYEEGLVSFYDVKSRSHIYSFTGQTFTEKLYPYFSPGFNNGGKNSTPLIISPVFKTDLNLTNLIIRW